MSYHPSSASSSPPISTPRDNQRYVNYIEEKRVLIKFDVIIYSNFLVNQQVIENIVHHLLRNVQQQYHHTMIYYQQNLILHHHYLTMNKILF